MPNQKLIAIYKEGEKSCYQLSKVYFTVGNRVIGNLWYIDNPKALVWFSKYKIVEKGFEPVLLSYEALTNQGGSCENFPIIGNEIYTVAEFGGDIMKLSDMKFIKSDELSIDMLNSTLITLENNLKNKPSTDKAAAKG